MKNQPKYSAEDLLATRQSLLNRLKNWQDDTGWRLFFDTYWRLIYGLARKVGLSDSEAQDVVQDTVIAVADQMPHFNYDPAVGSFRGWLMLITRRKVANHLRKKMYKRDGITMPREEPLNTDLLDNHPALKGEHWEEAWNKAWEKQVFDDALEKVVKQVSPGQYQMFFLHVLKGLSARETARRLEASLPAVYFAKYKITSLLRKEIAAMEG
jgi:RNA polymerase sigma factor (sigma-70 family)